MTDVAFAPLDSVPVDRWLTILNDPRVRRHLMPHPVFDEAHVHEWLAAKQAIDASPPGVVRAVIIDNQGCGYAGLQPVEPADAGRYEIAVVLYPAAWGAGAAVYRELMAQARRLGHRELDVALLESRPPVRAIARLHWRDGGEMTIAGERFRRYVVPISAA